MIQLTSANDEELDNQNQYGDEDYFDDGVDEGDISEYDDEYDEMSDYFEEDDDI